MIAIGWSHARDWWSLTAQIINHDIGVPVILVFDGPYGGVLGIRAGEVHAAKILRIAVVTLEVRAERHMRTRYLVHRTPAGLDIVEECLEVVLQGHHTSPLSSVKVLSDLSAYSCMSMAPTVPSL